MNGQLTRLKDYKLTKPEPQATPLPLINLDGTLYTPQIAGDGTFEWYGAGIGRVTDKNITDRLESKLREHLR